MSATDIVKVQPLYQEIEALIGSISDGKVNIRKR